MGIPERFYSYEIREQTQSYLNYPHAFISIPSRLETYGLDESKSDEILGHQYVLGIIPFTSLYLEHGIDSFFTESLVQHLHAQGIAPVIVSQRFSDSYRANALVLSAKLSASVYDLIFTRFVSFSGNLIVSGNDVEISFGDFYSQAQYPLIGHLLQTEVLEQLSKSKITDLMSYNQPHRLQGNKGFIPVVLEFPSVELADLSVLKKFAKTYGDSSAVFSTSMLARVVQRGAEAGVESIANLEPVAIAASFSNSDSFKEFTKIKIELTKLELKENLNVVVKYRISDQVAVCAISETIESSRDGSLNIALELAIKKTTRALLQNDREHCESAN